MKKISKPIVKSGVSLFALAMCAMPFGAQAGSFNDKASVVDVEEVQRTYTVRKPVEKCWTETVRVEKAGGGDGSFTNEIVGGLLGGVIGNQFGGGSGKDIATVGGAVLGASVAHDLEEKRPSSSHYEEVERCETTYSKERRTEIDYYLVTYSYGGQNFRTRMKSDPGSSIPVRVQVTPK